MVAELTAKLANLEREFAEARGAPQHTAQEAVLALHDQLLADSAGSPEARGRVLADEAHRLFSA